MKKLFKLKKCLVVFLIAFFSAGYVNAQKITVSGKLTDESGAPLVAASVAEVGTTNGAYTEMDGT